MVIIFYGPEGSGKSTQAKLLADKLHLPHLVSGDLVRKYAAEDQGKMGDICREALSSGHYVADTEMFTLWEARLKEPDVAQGFVVDGFPRNPAQSAFLAEKLKLNDQQVDHVFYLVVSEAESIKRLLKRARVNPDGTVNDTPEKIKSRLSHYQEQESAVLKIYEAQNLLIRINGEQTIEQIHQDVCQKLNL